MNQPMLATGLALVVGMAAGVRDTGSRAGAGQEPSPEKAIKRAQEAGAESIRAGDYAGAIRVLRAATVKFPEDAELHRLLAAAALDRAIEMDNDLDAAWSRLFLAADLKWAAGLAADKTTAYKEAGATLDAAVAEATRAYAASLRARPEVRRLLREALEEAQTAVARAGPVSRAALLAAWIDAYRVIEVDSARAAHLRFARIQAPGDPPVPAPLVDESQPEGQVDRTSVRKHALHLLAQMSQGHPDDPMPLLAAGEWLQLVEEGDPQSRLLWVRNRRYRNGVVDRDQAVSDAEAKEEYELDRRMHVGALDQANTPQILALYEEAARLDPKDEHGTAYGLYVQVLPADRQRAESLLGDLAREDPGTGLVPLERAREAAASQDYSAMLKELAIAAASTRLHRPLFTSLPDEVRRPFLSAHLLWEHLNAAGFGFQALERAFQFLTRSAAPDEERRLQLLKARIGGLLMQSDLPQDWAFGAKMREAALSKLTRDQDMPQDLASRVRAELQRTQHDAASRSLPLLFGVLWQNRVLFLPVTDGATAITGPSVIAGRNGVVGFGTD